VAGDYELRVMADHLTGLLEVERAENARLRAENAALGKWARRGGWRMYNLQRIEICDLRALDLTREAAEYATAPGEDEAKAYTFAVNDVTFEALYLPEVGRIGICVHGSGNADSLWANAATVEAGVALYVEDPDEFIARN